MAATVQSDPYSVFIRKIGYSVGLESTFSRVADLVRKYVEHGDITPSLWDELAHSERGWALKNDHIADFFRSIALLRYSRNDIQALACLDALALARVELGNDADFDVALKLILSSYLVISDGDVFLNSIAGEFDRQRVDVLLRQMIVTKRETVARVVKAPQLIERLVRVINIDTQATNTGGASVGKSLSQRLRTEPLKNRTEPLSRRSDLRKVDISDDYFRKVLGRRKDWARSLELTDEKGCLSERGNAFLDAFDQLGIRSAEGAFTYWPFVADLKKLALAPKTLQIPEITLSDHLKAIRKGLGAYYGDEPTREEISRSYIKLACAFFRTYQQLSIRRRMLRHEMPIEVLLHASVGYYSAKGLALPHVQEIILHESGKPNSRIIFRASRLFEGTVAVKT